MLAIQVAQCGHLMVPNNESWRISLLQMGTTAPNDPYLLIFPHFYSSSRARVMETASGGGGIERQSFFL